MFDPKVASMRRLLVLFGCMVRGVFAEIFALTKVPMPEKGALTSHYLFHVYANAVGPQASTTASVTFKNFEIKWSDGKVGIGDYQGLQVSLIPWSKFGRNMFCSDESSKLILKELAGAAVFDVGSTQKATFPITATDEYLLTVTNCGDRVGATITKGQVIVNQPHGYLPGNKIWTLQWWGWSTLVTTFLCIMWAVACARHCKAFAYTQKVISACAMLAFLEAAAEYVQHKDWNVTGIQRPVFAVATMFLYSFKYALTLHMLMESSAGSGITVERLQTSVSCMVDLVCCVFLVAQWVSKATLSRKYSLMLNPIFVYLVSLPGILLGFVLFIWICWKFHRLLSTMRDQKLADEVLTLLFRMRLVFVVSILLATVVLIFQFADLALSKTPWTLQWVAYDAAPQSVYTLFLLSLMILWWPHADSWKISYAAVDRGDSTIGVYDTVQAEEIGAAEAEEL